MESNRRQQLGDRSSEFKFQGLTPDELRRRREETSIEIRKSKREDTLNKRRTFLLTSSGDLPEKHEDSTKKSNAFDDVDVSFIYSILIFLD